MLQFILRRLGLVIPTFIGITLLTFAFVHMIPGDPVMIMAGERGISPERHAQLLAELGLDKPMWQQYLHYIWGVMHGDLGISLKSRLPVWEEFVPRFKATLELGVCAMIFAVAVGIPVGVLAAVKRGSIFDHTAVGLALTGYSMPIFWWGMMLIMLVSVHWNLTPVSGRVSDMVVARGGTSVLTEVPEMFGAESILLDRCENEQVFNAASDMLNGFKDYFISHGEVVYENPSPGNKDGGITTLEDKSCGCVQKGGSAPIVDVLPYAGQATKHGLNMLCGPGNDMVSTTALTAAGCHVILFSTGRGTPFGAPAPTLKVFTNQRLCDHKANWMDFNAGVIATGERTLDEAARDLYQLVLETASGKLTSAERRGCHEISIWKDGVCL